MTVSLLKCPSWYNLRGLGRSPISRMTILIPVFGSLILFSTTMNDLVVFSAEILNGDTNDTAQLQRWYLVNLYILYIGLMIFAVSTLAYNGLCPPIIRDFRTEYDYYEAEQKIMTKNRASLLQEFMEAKFSERPKFEFDVTHTDSDAARVTDIFESTIAENRETWLRAKSQPVSDLLQKHYTLENKSRKGVRRTIYVTYSISFACIAFPSIVMFVRVLQTLF